MIHTCEKRMEIEIKKKKGDCVVRPSEDMREETSREDI